MKYFCIILSTFLIASCSSDTTSKRKRKLKSYEECVRELDLANRCGTNGICIQDLNELKKLCKKRLKLK